MKTNWLEVEEKNCITARLTRFDLRQNPKKYSEAEALPLSVSRPQKKYNFVCDISSSSSDYGCESQWGEALPLSG